MASGSSTRVVIADIGAALAVAATKFAAAAFTRSSGMLSEGIHSLVDAFNAVLLLVGIRRSRRPPDDDHPFGHGLELYFWNLIVAVLIFGVGGGVSVYEGITHLLDPQPITSPWVNYLVLACAFAFEAGSAWVAFRHFVATKGDKGLWEAYIDSKDPTTATVLFSNIADLVGLLFAFLGVLLSYHWSLYWADGVASIGIGLALMAVAASLVRESRSLLLGEGADPKVVADIRVMVQADSAVERVGKPLTMHFGPNQILLNLDIQFRKGLSLEAVERAIDRLEKSIRTKYPQIQRIFLEVEQITSHGAGGPAGSTETSLSPM